MTMNTTRRNFLKSGAALAAGATTAVYIPWTQKAFANEDKNDRPQIGCIGLGGMGRGDARGHRGFGDLVAMCDVDKTHVQRANKEIAGGKADEYADYRRVLDRKDIDIVSIVTPDHWHVKIAIEALEAGKHVFCQKPLTLTLEENKLIRAACEKHKDKIFFVGTQQRSTRDKFVRAVNMVQKGLIGDVKKITVGINGAPRGGPFKTSAPPAGLDWNAWLGQAPEVDYIKERCHGNFRWWYEYSGGKFSDWGAHHVDIASWAINEVDLGDGPVEIDGTDASHPVPYEKGHATVDNKYNASHDFAVKCKFVSGIEMNITSRGDNGILFEGTKGRFFVNRGKIVGTPIKENWDAGKYEAADIQRLYKGKPGEGHKNNFYRCIREGGLPVSDVFSHVQVMNTCHLAAIAARVGRKIKWNPKTEQIVGDEVAASLASRTPRKGFEILKV